MNKHTILKGFIQEFIADTSLDFESVDMIAGARSLVPNYGDFTASTDIVGNKQKEYTFAFIGIENFDTSTSNLNENNMYLMDLFNDWILLQEKNRNYPDFGENVSDYKLEPLQNMANLALVDENTQTAKYMLAVKLSYTEKED